MEFTKSKTQGEKKNKSMNENILPVTSRKVWEDDAVATTLVAEQI